MADRPLRRRRRAARTCIECRRRKIKCDRQEPCNHCIATETTCRYRPFARTAEAPAVDANPDQVEDSQQQEQVGDDNAALNTASENSIGRPSSQATTTVPVVPLPIHARVESQSADPLWEHLLEKGIEAGKHQTNPNTTHPSPQEILQSKDPEGQHSQILLNKTRMLQGGHVLGSTPQFSTILSCFLAATGERPIPAFSDPRDGTDGMVKEMGQLLHECKDIARRIKESRPSRILSSVRFDLSLPSREISDTVAHLYFSHFESTHRILHTPSFWKEYHEFWDRENSIRQTLGGPQSYRSPTHTRLKILLVLAIGSALHSDATTKEGLALRARAQQWIHASQVWLSGPLEKDRLDISGIQIYCLTIIARQIFAIGGDLAWMSCGTLIHMAIQTGLHRDPKHFLRGSISVLDAEVRRRLWATILELVVGVSLDVALPPRLRWDEFDTEPPANLDDENLVGMESLEMVADTQPRGRERGVFTGSSMQLMMYESLELRLRVLEKLHGLKSELSYVEILSLSSDVSKAYSEALGLLNKFFISRDGPTPFTASPTTQEGPRLFHKNFLDLLLRRFLLHMHLSFAARAHAEPLFHFSLKTCLDVAIDMIHAVDPRPAKDTQQPQQSNAHRIATQQQQQPDPAFSRLMIIGGGMFREGVRSSLSIICLELLAIIQEEHGINHTLPTTSPSGPHPFFSPSNVDNHASPRTPASVSRIWQQSASTKIYITALKQTATQLTSLSFERMKVGGETNVKGYMFARLFLAEIDSIEAGLRHYDPDQTRQRNTEMARVGGERVHTEEATTIENAIARVGRDAMVICRDAMREWEVRAKEREGHAVSRSGSVTGMDTPRVGASSDDVSPFVPGPGVFGMPASSDFAQNGGSTGMIMDVLADQGDGLGMPPLANMPYGVAMGDGMGDYVGFSFDGFEGFGFEMGSGLHAFL